MSNDKTRNGVSRRDYLAAAGGAGATLGLAGCMGGGDGGDGGGGGEPINTEPPEEDVTIQIAADSNFANASEDIVQTLREDGGLPENISIEFLAGSFTTGDRRSQYQQILSAGQERPTVLMMDNGWTIPFIAREQLANLSEELPSSITDQVKDNYIDNMVATAQNADDDLFGIPLFADFPTIQYRKDLMREAGYTDEDFDTWATEAMTWQEFSTVVAETMEATDTQTGFTWQGASYEGLACCDFVEFMGSHGGSYFGEFENYFGPIGDRPVTVDEENVINAIRMMRTFINGSDDEVALDGYADISPDAVVQYTEEPSREPFTNGDVVAHRNWPYSININGAEDAFGEDLGVMPIPYAVSQEDSPYDSIGGSTSALGGWHLTLNPNASESRKRAALQLFKALQVDEVRLRMFEIGGWTPPISDLINTERTRELDIIGRYVDSLQVAGENALPRPVTSVWPQESSQIAKEVNASLRQQKTPTKAMSDLKEAIESIESSV
ncbi:extracellular solute-binding protein [Halobaculum rubrum]|uniref:extracellular solute-binding protein n=1 Tax=Halobaculum rubrum TaxID=2872158 RepID=UPI001CA423A6|nr:extracellular solute-binding protein [Halobaculum rubrum]QZX99474.1 extracellular solute-binding protein [Halobaculum rubrum]